MGLAQRLENAIGLVVLEDIATDAVDTVRPWRPVQRDRHVMQCRLAVLMLNGF